MFPLSNFSDSAPQLHPFYCHKYLSCLLLFQIFDVKNSAFGVICNNNKVFFYHHIPLSSQLPQLYIPFSKWLHSFYMLTVQLCTSYLSQQSLNHEELYQVLRGSACSQIPLSPSKLSSSSLPSRSQLSFQAHTNEMLSVLGLGAQHPSGLALVPYFNIQRHVTKSQDIKSGTEFIP